ncbi:MAG: LSm family protein [Nitrososphaeria archaeon]
MAYTIRHVQPLLGKYVHVRLHVGRECRGRLIEIQENGVIKLEPLTFIPLHLVESIFWSPTEEKGCSKKEAVVRA